MADPNVTPGAEAPYDAPGPRPGVPNPAPAAPGAETGTATTRLSTPWGEVYGQPRTEPAPGEAAYDQNQPEQPAASDRFSTWDGLVANQPDRPQKDVNGQDVPQETPVQVSIDILRQLAPIFAMIAHYWSGRGYQSVLPLAVTHGLVSQEDAVKRADLDDRGREQPSEIEQILATIPRPSGWS